MRLVPLASLVCMLSTLPAGAGSALELHVLDCGTLNGLESEAFLPGVDARPEVLDLVNRCYLVVHPKGTLLWDTGLPTSLTFRAYTWLMWLTTWGTMDVDMSASIVDQLAELGMTPADVDYVALSHSHFDHAGQAADFTASTWLVQKTEREFVFDPELDNESVFAELIEPLRDSETVLLDGDHDVFGDGSVEILSAPGHTPGHQCLYLDLAETGPVLLSGDLYHSFLNRELRVPPAFNTDGEQTKQSMQHIEALLVERGAELWIQHVPESGPLAPARLR